MEEGSPSRRSGASRLNPNAQPFSPSSLRSEDSRGGRLCFSDCEASSDGSASQSPPPAVVGVTVAANRRQSRRRRRLVPRGRGPRAAAVDGAPARRLHSVVVAHPARLSSEPDADGFREVHSRRRWRRWMPQRPRSPRPVPEDLVGLCFNCASEGAMSRRTAGSRRVAAPARLRGTGLVIALSCRPRFGPSAAVLRLAPPVARAVPPPVDRERRRRRPPTSP